MSEDPAFKDGNRVSFPLPGDFGYGTIRGVSWPNHWIVELDHRTREILDSPWACLLMHHDCLTPTVVGEERYFISENDFGWSVQGRGVICEVGDTELLLRSLVVEETFRVKVENTLSSYEEACTEARRRNELAGRGGERKVTE